MLKINVTMLIAINPKVVSKLIILTDVIMMINATNIHAMIKLVVSLLLYIVTTTTHVPMTIAMPKLDVFILLLRKIILMLV